MGTVLKFRGTHSTTNEKTETIRLQGFKLSSNGSVGSGVYFWKEAPWSSELALGWMIYQKKTGRIQCEECVVITASFNADEAEYLNFTDFKLKCEVYKLAKEKGINTSNHLDIAPVFTMLAAESSKVTGHPVKVLEVELPAPAKVSKEVSYYQAAAFGRPPCYIVTEPDIIVIEKQEVFKIA